MDSDSYESYLTSIYLHKVINVAHHLFYKLISCGDKSRPLP